MTTTQTPTSNSQTDSADTGHEYDGIHEHDNRLPRWWLITLWATIVFGVGYWFVYHTFGYAPLPRAQFDEQMLAIAKATPVLDDNALVTFSKDAATVERGRAVFTSTCLACHGPDGQGVVGPNLTDEAWIHGDKPTDIWHVVKDGQLTFGMPAWGASLGPDKVRDVTAFVLTLRGKNVPGKPPQGPRDVATPVSGGPGGPGGQGDPGAPGAPGAAGGQGG